MNDLDARRLEALCSYGILDTPPEPAFDEIAQLAAQLCATPIAYVGLMGEARQWFKARVGTLIQSVPREETICRYALDQTDVLVIPDTLKDTRVARNPHVVGEPYVRFYAGAPLIDRKGVCLGTLCAIDIVPRVLTVQQRDSLAMLARQVVSQLELRRALADVQKHQKRLIELQWHKEQLTNLVVHDLKAPLTALIGWTELLNAAPDPAKELESYGWKIFRTAHTMNRMVMNMLDIAVSEDGQLKLRSERLPLDRVVREAAEIVRTRLEEKRQRLVVSSGLHELSVWADPDVTRRVIENLLDNCVKYAPTDSEIGIDGSRAGRSVELAIRDTGPGIPDDKREAIFQKYVRLDGHDAASARRSHGLGLVFCRLAVEASGGSIRVDEATPQGAVFRVQWPASPVDQVPVG